jgi:ElaB/YqjD/DUF883 family membrane-anchored ribosome-binding protein
MNAIPEPSRADGQFSARQIERRVGERFRDANRQLSSYDRDIQRFVRRKPMTAAFTALAVGFILGRMASRF